MTSFLQSCDLVSLQYEPRATLGRAPSPRGYHASFLADSRLFIFGGFNGHDVFDDVHVLDLAAAAYLPQVTSFSIDAQ
jgi:Rab9 effector protein with kelch motifs